MKNEVEHMDLNTQLKKYAQLIAKVGLNIQKDQPVLIRASTETRDFVDRKSVV